MRIGRRFVGFIVVLQAVLFLVHLVLYETWEFSIAGSPRPTERLSHWFSAFIGELCRCFVAGLSLYQCFCPRVLQGGCSLDGAIDFSFLQRSPPGLFSESPG